MADSNQKKNVSASHAEAVLSIGSNSPGEIRITTSALAVIIRRAACSVDGVSRIAGNNLVDNIAEFVGSKKVMDRSIQINLSESDLQAVIAINIRYGFSLPDVAAEVQKSVVQQIREFTGLQASRVDVIIREMEFPRDDDDDENE